MTDQASLPDLNNHSIHLLNVRQGQRETKTYTYILFRNNDGKDAIALHGLSMKRRDGSFTIRGVLDQPNQSQINIEAWKVLDEVELFRGSGEEYLCKMVCATDAMKCLNAQNLDYFPRAEGGVGSNSVAYSLVQLMGLDIPSEIAGAWKEGQAQSVLPGGWASEHAGGEGDPKALLLAFKDHVAAFGARAVQQEAWNSSK